MFGSSVDWLATNISGAERELYEEIIQMTDSNMQQALAGTLTLGELIVSQPKLLIDLFVE